MSLLQVDPDKRISPDQCLNHPWLTQHSEEESKEGKDNKRLTYSGLLSHVMDNLSNLKIVKPKTSKMEDLMDFDFEIESVSPAKNYFALSKGHGS